MDKNFTNINTAREKKSSPVHILTTMHGMGRPCFNLGQAQRSGKVLLIHGIPTTRQEPPNSSKVVSSTLRYDWDSNSQIQWGQELIVQVVVRSSTILIRPTTVPNTDTDSRYKQTRNIRAHVKFNSKRQHPVTKMLQIEIGHISD